MDEARQLTSKELSKCLIVAQTTYTVKDFQEISSFIESQATDCIVENTICEDTWMRQDEAESLSKRVDYVIVVGGRESSNTKHLAELAQRYGKPVQYVETAQEIDLSQFSGSETVGILAGASTPTWLVDEVVDYLEETNDSLSKLVKKLSRAFLTPLIWSTSVASASLGASQILNYPNDFLLLHRLVFIFQCTYLLLPRAPRSWCEGTSQCQILRNKSLFVIECQHDIGPHFSNTFEASRSKLFSMHPSCLCHQSWISNRTKYSSN